MAKRMQLDKQSARVISVVVTRPDDKRTLREASTAMAIDRTIQEALGEYDTQLEALIRDAKRAVREMEGSSLRDEQNRINARIESLDEEAAGQMVELVLENAEFDFAWSNFKDLRGVPADRRNGVIYQRIKEAFEAAERV